MSTREAIIESLAGTSVTSFKGHRPTATDIDTLEKELAIIAATVKTSLFEGGQLHGHLCNVISNESYAAIVGNPDFVLNEPAVPEAFNLEILPQMGEVQHKTLESEWDKHKQHYQAYLGVQEVLRKSIVGAVDSQYLRETYNEYTGYSQHTARALIDHIRGKVKLTTTEKAKMRDQVNFEWDQSQDFASYIVELEQIKRRLGRWGITIDEDTLIATAIKQVNKSTLFTRVHKKAWEDLEEEERDWELFKTYFIEKYDEGEQYANETTGRGGLQGIHHVNEEIEGNDDELTEYLYELKLAATENSETIQQVNTKTLHMVAELTACIKMLTETTASQQKTITSQQHTIAGLMGNNSDSGSGRGGVGNTRSNNNRGLGQKKKCTNCGKEGYHKEEDCLELPTNEGRRMTGWKSVFAGMKNPHYTK
jgi:hypothetical protein